MKTILTFSLSFLLFFSASAQDTILKRNSDTILAKVTEVSSLEIKYKRINEPNNSIHSINKDEVKRIKYKNGLVDDFHLNPDSKIKIVGNNYFYNNNLPIRIPELNTLLENTKDEKINLFLDKSIEERRKRNIAFLGIPCGVAAIGLVFVAGFQEQDWSHTKAQGGNYKPLTNSQTNTINAEILSAAVLGTLSIGFPILSLVHHQKEINNRNKAIELYNQNF